MSTFKKVEPPKPVRGIAYKVLDDEKLCSECGRLVLAHQLVIHRNARGKTFEEILPLKNGICLNCAADGLSEKSVAEYEKVLDQLENYEILREKKEITETEEKYMRLLERQISNLQDFVDELSDFVEYTEKSGVAYYNDQLEDDNE